MNINVTNIPGYNGGSVIADTTTTTPPEGTMFVGLHVITETVIDEIEGNLAGVESLEGATLPAGAVIPGRFSSVKLTSGIVVAVLE